MRTTCVKNADLRNNEMRSGCEPENRRKRIACARRILDLPRAVCNTRRTVSLMRARRWRTAGEPRALRVHRDAQSGCARGRRYRGVKITTFRVNVARYDGGKLSVTGVNRVRNRGERPALRSKRCVRTTREKGALFPMFP